MRQWLIPLSSPLCCIVLTDGVFFSHSFCSNDLSSDSNTVLIGYALVVLLKRFTGLAINITPWETGHTHHQYIYSGLIYIYISRGRPWYSGSTLDCWSTGRVIYLAPGAWFIAKFIPIARLPPAQYSLTVQNHDRKNTIHSLYISILNIYGSIC